MHAVKTSSHRICETRCGLTVPASSATVWWREISCKDCLAGTSKVDQDRDALEELYGPVKK